MRWKWQRKPGRTMSLRQRLLWCLLPLTLLITAAALVFVRSFLGREGPYPRHPHEVSLPMWLGPMLLAIGGFVLGALFVSNIRDRIGTETAVLRLDNEPFFLRHQCSQIIHHLRLYSPASGPGLPLQECVAPV